MKEKKISYFIPIFFIIILYYLVSIRTNYYLGSIFLKILEFIFFWISIYFSIKVYKKYKHTITVLTIITLLLSIFYTFEPLILTSLGYKTKAELIDAEVLDYQDKKDIPSLLIGETNKNLRRDTSIRSYGKYKLLNNNKIVRLYNAFPGSKGDKVQLVKLIFYKDTGLFKQITIYKPSNYKVKYFSESKNNNTIIYQDLINEITINIDKIPFKDIDITYSSDYCDKTTVCFMFGSKEEIETILEKLVPFKLSNYEVIHDTEFAILYYYEYEWGINLKTIILKIKKSNDYILITVPQKYNIEKEKLLNIFDINRKE